MYIKIKNKFYIVSIATILFFCFQVWFLTPWILDIAKVCGMTLSIIIIGGVAIGLGLLNFFLVMSMFFDNQKDIYTLERHDEDVSILIAAYNEEESIYETLLSLSNQKYDATMYVYVIVIFQLLLKYTQLETWDVFLTLTSTINHSEMTF